MGVSGSGKTMVGQALAQALGAQFVDADWLHSHDNIETMAAGHPLSDEQREPWLRAVGASLREARDQDRDLVVACSALKRSYRDILRTFVSNVYFVFLDAPREVLAERVSAREHDFMPASLLDSQLATLQPLGEVEYGARLDATKAPDEIVGEVIDLLS